MLVSLVWGLLGWAVAAGAFTVLALVACARLERLTSSRHSGMTGDWPSIWILRPCEGSEPHLDENLASSLVRYPGPRRVVLLVPSLGDPAYAVAARLAASDPAVEVVVTDIASTGNRKSAQLAVGLARAAATTSPTELPELIVQADSDVRLEEDSLVDLVAALGAKPTTAAAFAVPIELAVESLGDFIAAALLTASHQNFFALAALAEMSGGVKSMAGALAVHRRSELERSGGFAPLERVLGEDFEIARRLHARGLDVAVARRPIRSLASGRTIGEVLARTARWVTVVRRQRGALFLTYPLLLAPTPILIAAGCALFGRSPLPLAAATALLALRALLAWRLRRIHDAPIGPLSALAMAAAAELLLLVASVRASVSSNVTWRGRRLRIAPGGVVEGMPP